MFIFEIVPELTLFSDCLYKICLCIFFFSLSLKAQDPHPAFKSYDVEDGLPSSKIYQVKQDSKGYIWLATDNGISRFNGYKFENFSVSNGLPENTVFEIFEDKKGRIWFLTLTNKICYYEHHEMHLYKYNHVIDKIEGNHVKTSFCVAENGSVFIGLFSYGIIEVTDQGELKKHFELNVAKPTVAVIEPVSGSLIYVYNSKGKVQYRDSILFNTESLKEIRTFEKSFFSLYPTSRFIKLRNNNMVFSVDNKLYMIDRIKGYDTKLFNERINWIFEDKENDLWIGTYLGGVYYIKNGDFEHKKNYLKGLFLTGITQDSEGGFWFTTEGNSLFYTPSKQILTYDQSSGLKDSRVTCLASDTEGIYLGLSRPLIHKINSSGQITSYNCPAGNKAISSLHYEPETSALWFSGSELAGYMMPNKRFVEVRNNFARVIRGSGNVYWYINSDGLFKLKDKKRYEYAVKTKRMSAIIKKDDNTFLIGAIDGLWQYTISDSSSKHVMANNPLMCNRVLDLAYTSNGNLLLATKGGGLLIVDKHDRVQQISRTDGLSSNNIYKILIDDSVIWLATDKGLNKLIKSKSHFGKIKIFTNHDGLISNEIYDVRKFDHKIWVATDKGLSFFGDTLENRISFEMPVYVNKIIINDSSTFIRKKYKLAYFENNIKINFLALGYRNTGKLYYRYKMEGLNAEWNYTEEREIQYTTLPPGNYTFAVSVLNENGIWSRDVSIKFAIATPFWKAWWFVVIAVILVIIILFFVINYWIARKHREKNKEEEINQILLQLKLKALRAQMNPHFIFNVMNSIQHFILFNNNHAAHRYLSKFSKLIRAILNNSEENTVPLAEEVKALTLYLELEDMRFENHFQYTIDIDETIDIHTTEIPSMLIQPYVENAVKHGMLHSVNEGRIKIKIEKQINFLKCSIEDNGVGLEASRENKNSKHRSFGTFITKERLQIINELYNNKLTENVISLYDKEGNAAGTKIEIFIPYTVNKKTHTI